MFCKLSPCMCFFLHFQTVCFLILNKKTFHFFFFLGFMLFCVLPRKLCLNQSLKGFSINFSINYIVLALNFSSTIHDKLFIIDNMNKGWGSFFWYEVQIFSTFLGKKVLSLNYLGRFVENKLIIHMWDCF